MASCVMEFDEADQFLTDLDQRDAHQLSFSYAFENGIERARHLLVQLGGAPNISRRCVVVTGSKGKGSTTILVANVLAAAGYKVGVFTGPHLHHVVERFAMSHPGDPATPVIRSMPETVFAKYATEIRHIVNTWDAPAVGLPTRFEAYTTIAYRWFEACKCDLALFEVGIGGRDDTTNLGEPFVSVFANISLEHTEMLGSTVEKIAEEKSGIMRPHGHAVSARQLTVVERVLRSRAAEIGCPFWLADEHWHVAGTSVRITPERSGQMLSLSSLTRSVAIEVFLPLLGEVQIQNVATALTTLDALRLKGFATSMSDVEAGFAGVRWPGRFEVIGLSPLVIADGAHTPYSMKMLALSLGKYFKHRDVHMVIGILRDKDARGILESISQVATSLTLTSVQNRRTLPVDQLSSLCNELGLSHKVVGEYAESSAAFISANARAGADAVVCITGSLHLVSEAQTNFSRLYST